MVQPKKQLLHKPENLKSKCPPPTRPHTAATPSGTVVRGTHVIEKFAVACGPADLHDARSDHGYFIVPHPSIHTKGATHTFKRRGITASLGKPESVTVAINARRPPGKTACWGGWLHFFLLKAAGGLLFPSQCARSDGSAKLNEAHAILHFSSQGILTGWEDLKDGCRKN